MRNSGEQVGRKRVSESMAGNAFVKAGAESSGSDMTLIDSIEHMMSSQQP